MTNIELNALYRHAANASIDLQTTSNISADLPERDEASMVYRALSGLLLERCVIESLAAIRQRIPTRN